MCRHRENPTPQNPVHNVPENSVPSKCTRYWTHAASYRKLWWLDGKTHTTMEMKYAIYHVKLRRDENIIKHRTFALQTILTNEMNLTINSEFKFISVVLECFSVWIQIILCCEDHYAQRLFYIALHTRSETVYVLTSTVWHNVMFVSRTKQTDLTLVPHETRTIAMSLNRIVKL